MNADILSGLYHRIRGEPLKPGTDHVTQVEALEACLVGPHPVPMHNLPVPVPLTGILLRESRPFSAYLSLSQDSYFSDSVRIRTHFSRVVGGCNYSMM